MEVVLLLFTLSISGWRILFVDETEKQKRIDSHSTRKIIILGFATEKLGWPFKFTMALCVLFLFLWLPLLRTLLLQPILKFIGYIYIMNKY